MSDDDKFGKAAAWEKWIGFLGVVVVVYLIASHSDTINEQTVRGWYRVVLVGALLATPALIVFAIWRQDGLARAGWLLAPLIVAAGLLLYDGINSTHARQHGYLADYCRYGAVSQAQLDGCLDHVTYKQVYRLNTHAAQFANRDLDDCLEDSGPFCLEALTWNLAMDQAPPPGQ